MKANYECKEKRNEIAYDIRNPLFFTFLIRIGIPPIISPINPNDVSNGLLSNSISITTLKAAIPITAPII